jgi:hypothetical protein
LDTRLVLDFNKNYMNDHAK